MAEFMDFIRENAGLMGLLFFFAFFVVMFAWTFRPSAKDKYKKQGLIPLEENE